MTRRLRPDEKAAWEALTAQVGKQDKAPRKPRELRPEEAALWEQVAAQVRPLGNRPSAPALPRVRPPKGPRAEPVMPAVARHLADVSVTEATLDAVWDRKIRTGEVLPDLVVDLHGYTREAAYKLLERRLRQAWERRARVVLIVTGKGRSTTPWPETPRGILKEELPRWLDEPGLRPYVSALRPAHQRHGGMGAFYAILRRVRGDRGE
ncbi:Smr/MutS family protein [Pedomonas sp. V897]|uniref:Smr/MutS family protein n=1 Tax=Pedomonas sp. V897 TaxID=3446482 RepID=UPI003EE1C862